MSEYSAKGLREKMKAKARSLAGEKDQKTDSSDWSPAEPLNADAKTGMRPISQRAYKGGGKVDGKTVKPRADRKARKAGGKVESEIGVGMANKNMKEANKDRPGVKHIGGLKHGGKARATGGSVPSKAETQTTEKRIGKEQIVPKRGAAGHYKKGGRTKKADGGFLDNLVNALSGKGYIDGSTWIPKEAPVTASDAVESISPAQYAKERAMARQNMRAARPPRLRRAQADRELAMGRELQRNADIMPGAYDTVQSDRFMKKGGKVKKAGGGGSWLEKMVGGSESEKQARSMRDVGKSGTANYTQEDKGALNRAIKGDDALPAAGEAAERSGKYQNYKKGGRTAKATGGSLISALKGPKKSRSKGAKTDINIVINAGHKAPMKHPDAGLMPPLGGDGMAPLPTPPVGAPAPAMPVGPAAGPALPPGLPGRKAGGRITKVAKSYKDMEAGAGSGEGRLQKTDIAKLHKDAPARKAGGRITKVAKSYKDMEAGAGSGEGRLQKEDIAKAKKGRAK